MSSIPALAIKEILKNNELNIKTYNNTICVSDIYSCFDFANITILDTILEIFVYTGQDYEMYTIDLDSPTSIDELKTIISTSLDGNNDRKNINRTVKR